MSDNSDDDDARMRRLLAARLNDPDRLRRHEAVYRAVTGGAEPIRWASEERRSEFHESASGDSSDPLRIPQFRRRTLRYASGRAGRFPRADQSLLRASAFKSVTTCLSHLTCDNLILSQVRTSRCGIMDSSGFKILET